MNRLFCWLTGGHRYAPMNLRTCKHPFTREIVVTDWCIKCGKRYRFSYDIDPIIEKDLKSRCRKTRVNFFEERSDNNAE